MDVWEELSVSYSDTTVLDAWSLLNNLLLVTVIGDTSLLISEDTLEVFSEVSAEEVIFEIVDSSSIVSENTSEITVNVTTEELYKEQA